MIYHVLPECEPLSANKGGALAHTVANLIRLDRNRVAVCPGSDDTWNLPAEKVMVIPCIKLYGRIRARRFLPIQLIGPALRWVYKPLIEQLAAGDVVWFHNRPVFAAALSLAAKSKGAKVVYHFHDGLDQRTARMAFRHFTPDATIFVSEYLRQLWLQVIPRLQNAYTVHNGADETQFYPRRDDGSVFDRTPVILFVGRLNPIKGAHVLIQAMKLLAERGVPALCKMIGSSYSGNSQPTPYMQKLKNDCPTNVEFTGFCSATEIGDQYRSADILCCPSVWQEPFGKVNVEAMACGLPVVASRVGGIPEIAKEGGILLVDHSSPTQLADTLECLLVDLDLRKRVGRKGRESFEQNFTWSAVLKQYNQITASL